MQEYARTTAFKRDYKREKKTDPNLDRELLAVVALLMKGQKLPDRLEDHGLSGDWKGHRDCHIKPDLVLIYKASKDTLTLIRIGSHSELFG